MAEAHKTSTLYQLQQGLKDWLLPRKEQDKPHKGAEEQIPKIPHRDKRRLSDIGALGKFKPAPKTTQYHQSTDKWRGK